LALAFPKVPTDRRDNQLDYLAFPLFGGKTSITRVQR